jgi:hypothetical protein
MVQRAGGDAPLEGVPMSQEQTRSIMEDYFAAMSAGQFAAFFSDDVTWTTMESGEVVRGPLAVQAAIIGLHARMPGVRTRQLVVAEQSAFIEGDCAPGSGSPIAYCVAYDIAQGRIAAMRYYGELAALMPDQTQSETTTR